METSHTTVALTKALCKAQASFPVAKKDSENPHFKSKYADIASVIEAVRKPLAENDLAIVQAPETEPDGRFTMTTMLLHSSGEWIKTSVSMAIERPGNPQSLGSFITYLRRYCLTSILGIATDEDDDGNASSVGKADEKKQDQKDEPTEGQKSYLEVLFKKNKTESAGDMAAYASSFLNRQISTNKDPRLPIEITGTEANLLIKHLKTK